MKTIHSRRSFIRKSTFLCGAGCCLIAFNSANVIKLTHSDEVIDPKSFNYCGYKCPEDCKFLKGSIESNIELKKEAYADWHIKERLGLEFDPDKIFCFGCKNADKPEGVVMKNCSVRTCAKEKGFDCCIECKQLPGCEKELWSRFPDFKKYVEDLQQKYFKAVKG